MSVLDDLLAMPGDSEKRPEPWQELTRGDTLFRALHEAVKRSAGCDWASLHEVVMRWQQECLNYLPEQKQVTELTKWDVVRRLLWCAEQAAVHSDFYRTEIDRVCFALANIPEFIKSNEAWAWACVRTLLDAPSRWAEVSVALVDERRSENDGAGFIATLVLEAIEGRAGQIVHHPIDGFYPCGDKDFLDSMNGAWAAARTLLREQGVDVQRGDGRWRLLRGDGQPIQEVSGRSASGAAAWGAWFAMQGKMPDEGVIVLAQVDENDVRLLKEVKDVRAKVKAIAEYVRSHIPGEGRRLDTIAVVGENFQEAQDALDKAVEEGVIKSGAIRVVDIAKYRMPQGTM